MRLHAIPGYLSAAVLSSTRDSSPSASHARWAAPAGARGPWIGLGASFMRGRLLQVMSLTCRFALRVLYSSSILRIKHAASAALLMALTLTRLGSHTKASILSTYSCLAVDVDTEPFLSLGMLHSQSVKNVGGV